MTIGDLLAGVDGERGADGESGRPSGQVGGGGPCRAGAGDDPAGAMRCVAGVGSCLTARPGAGGGRGGTAGTGARRVLLLDAGSSAAGAPARAEPTGGDLPRLLGPQPGLVTLPRLW